ncbi:hypothetical protein [Aliagarivorans taiwanensis]|uniref:hypothetical protein n=1 Tax=Aliagarivorans taiwanensis TaxID=561966 RepID=UPI0003FBB5F6|nr:hypothetical protein [Aliagarivorans taiwanensis]
MLSKLMPSLLMMGALSAPALAFHEQLAFYEQIEELPSLPSCEQNVEDCYQTMKQQLAMQQFEIAQLKLEREDYYMRLWELSISINSLNSLLDRDDHQALWDSLDKTVIRRALIDPID